MGRSPSQTTSAGESDGACPPTVSTVMMTSPVVQESSAHPCVRATARPDLLVKPRAMQSTACGRKVEEVDKPAVHRLGVLTVARQGGNPVGSDHQRQHDERDSDRKRSPFARGDTRLRSWLVVTEGASAMAQGVGTSRYLSLNEMKVHREGAEYRCPLEDLRESRPQREQGSGVPSANTSHIVTPTEAAEDGSLKAPATMCWRLPRARIQKPNSGICRFSSIAAQLRPGPHMRSILVPQRWVTAEQLCQRMQGMCACSWWPRLRLMADLWSVQSTDTCCTGRSTSVREETRSAFATCRLVLPSVRGYLPGEEFAVTVHGRAELFELSDPARGELRQAMLNHYLPLQGPSFEEWLDQEDAMGARIVAEKVFTFHLP